MNQSVRKLLSLMLIFLLGLSPLQPVLADLSVPVNQNNMPCHMSADSVDMTDTTLQSANDCKMCSASNDCNNSCGQCAFSGLALLQGLPFISSNTSSLAIIRLDEETTSQQPPALFRPPRV